MKIKIYIILIFFCAISLPCETFPKCALQKIVVKGKVQTIKKMGDNTITKSLAGATIFLFIDDSQYTMSNGAATQYPDFFITADDGTFMAISYYRETEVPYYETRNGKERLIRGKCLGFPEKMEIIVTMKDFSTKRIIFKFDNSLDLNMVINQKDDLIVELPPIVLESK